MLPVIKHGFLDMCRPWFSQPKKTPWPVWVFPSHVDDYQRASVTKFFTSLNFWTFNPSVTSVTWCSVVKSRELFCWLSLRFKLPYHCEQSISIMSRSPGKKKKHEKTRPATTTLEYFGYVSETQPTGPETSLSPGHRPVGFPPMATSKKAFLVTLGVTLA